MFDEIDFGFWVTVAITVAVAIRCRGYIGIGVMLLMAAVVTGRFYN